jgi:hypothetical protein
MPRIARAIGQQETVSTGEPMANSHPYISGAGNITAIITQLRKNFPTTVTSETIKKLGIASNNESYVINALQFIGLIDEEGKRTDKGHEVLATHDNSEFQGGFGALVRAPYSDLFDTHGDGAWELDRDKLVNYFRKSDKTSDIIGRRQAGVFSALAALAGHAEVSVESTTKPKPKSVTAKSVAKKKVEVITPAEPANIEKASTASFRRDMALTVRIEINLPAGGTQETYGAIFKSIKANLIDE